MSSRSNFLNLILPELYEFVNSWNAPVNQNMESIDDFCEDLSNSLIGTSATPTWAALRGSLGSLATRLDVSINADGTLDLSSSPGLLDMAESAWTGSFGSPVARLNDTDAQLYAAGAPVDGGRFTPIPAFGSAGAGSPHSGAVSTSVEGYPHGGVADALALVGSGFGRSLEQSSSPHHLRGWEPGLVVGGGSPFITGVGAYKIRFNSGTAALFNIDGYAFRLREDVELDYSGLGVTPTHYAWVYVERVQAGYTPTALFKFAGAGGTPAQRDLRKLQPEVAASDGSSSGNLFTSPSAKFLTGAPLNIGKVKPGDVLVVESGLAQGEYVIEGLVGGSEETNLTIKGVFPAAVTGFPWHVRDNWHPNFGVVSTGSTSATARPPKVEGRVYIGRFIETGALLAPTNFAQGGSVDSGWLAGISTSFVHNLGANPASVDVWCRVIGSGVVYRPVVRREFMTSLAITGIAPIAGDRKHAPFLVPSLYVRSTEMEVTLALLNANPDSLTGSPQLEALFTDSAGVDQLAGGCEIRVVVRR